MSHKHAFKANDRVTVKGGRHNGEKGRVVRRESAAYVVQLDNGTTVNRMATSLHKLPCSLTKVMPSPQVGESWRGDTHGLG